MIYNVKVLPTNDTKIQLIGSIISALVGALVGAIVAFGLSEIVRRKQIALNEVREVRMRIRANQRAISVISANVHGSLILILKNVGHYGDLSKGILNSSNMLRATLSLPLAYPDDTTSPADIINIQLIAVIDSYVNELVLQNINIVELNKYYSDLLTTSHAIFLQGGSVNPSVIATDNYTIKKASKSQIKASTSFYDKCVNLMALMELLVEQYEKLDYTKISLSDIRNYEIKLMDYQPKKRKIIQKEKVLREKYTANNAFLVA